MPVMLVFATRECIARAHREVLSTARRRAEGDRLDRENMSRTGSRFLPADALRDFHVAGSAGHRLPFLNDEMSKRAGPDRWRRERQSLEVRRKSS